jgi:hypothetical protein
MSRATDDRYDVGVTGAAESGRVPCNPMTRPQWHARDLGDEFVLDLPIEPPDAVESEESSSHMERLLGAAVRASRVALRDLLLDVHGELFGATSVGNDAGQLAAAHADLLAAAQSGRVVVTRNPRKPVVSPLACDGEEEAAPVSA